jgi:hypothetical protein
MDNNCYQELQSRWENNKKISVYHHNTEYDCDCFRYYQGEVTRDMAYQTVIRAKTLGTYEKCNKIHSKT